MLKFWSDYVHLMQEPSHVAVEFTFVAFDYFIIRLVVRQFEKRRDRKHNHE